MQNDCTLHCTSLHESVHCTSLHESVRCTALHESVPCVAQTVLSVEVKWHCAQCGAEAVGGVGWGGRGQKSQKANQAFASAEFLPCPDGQQGLGGGGGGVPRRAGAGLWEQT